MGAAGAGGGGGDGAVMARFVGRLRALEDNLSLLRGRRVCDIKAALRPLNLNRRKLKNASSVFTAQRAYEAALSDMFDAEDKRMRALGLKGAGPIPDDVSPELKKLIVALRKWGRYLRLE